MAFSGKINVKPGPLTLGDQFEVYKRDQLECKIQRTYRILDFQNQLCFRISFFDENWTGRRLISAMFNNSSKK